MIRSSPRSLLCSGMLLLTGMLPANAGNAIHVSDERPLPLAWQSVPGFTPPLQSLMRPAQPHLSSVSTPWLQLDGLRFKDLNRSGTLEPYEDWRLPPARRAHDLLSRMTLPEKAGTMVHAIPGTDGSRQAPGSQWDLPALERLILEAGITTFINKLRGDARSLAMQANQAQTIAERGRLGIPLSFSSDPRNQARYSPSRFVDPGSFTQWPMATGLAASDDPDLVRRSAIAARVESRAAGIQIQLGPAMDLATDARWARLNESFGSDPERSGRLARAYIEGLQGGSLGVARQGVAAVAKHWVGYGASRDGFDGLNYYGREVDFRDADLARRIRPFELALSARPGAVMTAYSLPPDGIRLTPAGPPLPRIGAAFSQPLVQQLLRQRYGYDGIVITDWVVVDDCDRNCRDGNPLQPPSFHGFGTPWGVEALDRSQRFKLALDAGVDQFGGNHEPHYLVELVKRGMIPEARLDQSVQRILLQKFQLGLFEEALVDPEQAAQLIGNARHQQWAQEAQQRATVLLKNQDAQQQPLLPLRQLPRSGPGRLKVYLAGIDHSAAQRHGLEPVASPELAELSVMRMQTPFETLHPHHVIGAMQHEGSLAFADDHPQLKLLRQAARHTPVIVSLFMDRPAVVHNFIDDCAVLLADFGISDDALLALLTGPALPDGHLPFPLPASMDEFAAPPVAQRQDAAPGASEAAPPTYRPAQASISHTEVQAEVQAGIQAGIQAGNSMPHASITQ